MKRKYTVFAVFFAILVLIGIQAVEDVKANPVYWPTTPIQDKPTLTIGSPTNNTAYNNTTVYVSLTVTKPDSWKREGLMAIPMFYARLNSVRAYLDGKSVPLTYNYTEYAGDPWVKDQGLFSVLNKTEPGQHTLNVTVVALSYYRGPAYNGSHIPSETIESSDGTVYQYPIVVSDIVYFTVEQPTPTQTANASVSDYLLNQTNLILIAIVIAIVAVASISLVYFKKHKSKTELDKKP